MRIAFFGAGAVGSYFGGRLIQSGTHDISLIARGAHLEALRADGLRIESPAGDAHVSPGSFMAVSSPADVGQVDVVFVTVKAWLVREAARAITPLLGTDTLIIPLQNGVEAADQLLEELPNGSDVIGGTCRIFAERAAPGLVRHTGVPPTITIGCLDGEESEPVRRASDALLSAGIDATVRADIRTALWEKLLFVGPLAGVGAVTREPIGVFRSVPQSRALLTACMQEILAVAKAAGVEMPADAFEGAMRLVELAPPGGTASMQRDIAAGRPSELEAQVGVIPRLGQLHGVPTPTHDSIYASLVPSELRARGEIG